jgi:hypothetical protein
MSGMPDKLIFHVASIFVVVLLSEDGFNVSTLFPTTGPSVIFVSTTNCSGFTVTNWWVFVSPCGPASSVTSLSITLPVSFIFFIALKVDQYFVSLSISNTIFQI